VNINVRGEEDNLQKFIQWIQDLISVSLIINDKPIETTLSFSSEFDIFKVADLPNKKEIQKQDLSIK
jgi:acylphosphatase